MDKKEAAKILSVLFSEYPHYFSKMKESDIKGKVNLWASLFADDEYKAVGQALKLWLITDTSGYPPTVGQIKDSLYKLTAQPELTESEAWARLMKAAENGYYNSRAEFSKLPEIVKRIIGDHRTLIEYSQMSTNELNTVVQSNFNKMYRAELERERLCAKLPDDMRQLGTFADYDELTPPEQIRAIEQKFMEIQEG